MIKSSSLIMFTLVSTIVIAFICYMLMNKVWKIERAEAAVLLED
jgi:high-affinity Fe2+/Pb2+ permease